MFTGLSTSANLVKDQLFLSWFSFIEKVKSSDFVRSELFRCVWKLFYMVYANLLNKVLL